MLKNDYDKKRTTDPVAASFYVLSSLSSVVWFLKWNINKLRGSLA